jgi:hypothetical protein
MTQIHVDDKTAKHLARAAELAGLTLEDYLKILVQGETPMASEQKWDAIEQEILALSSEGTLPSDFSRADIYLDHN